MKNTIIYLIGFPGVGKLTIAKELCTQSGAKLVDNHLINNPIFSLIRKEGKPIPQKAWNIIEEIRDNVLLAIKTLGAPEDSYIFTNVLLKGSQGDLEIYKKIEELANDRKANFIPITLTCDLEENKNRISNTSRNAHFKMTCPDKLQQQYTNGNNLLTPEHSNYFNLDITNLTPEQATAAILAHYALP